MKSFNYLVKDELGIHARPAGMLAKEAKQFQSTVKLTKGEKTVSASQLMMLMSLGVKKGDEVTITVEGADEDTAVAALEAFFNANL
jgi:phosphocarrier protein